MTADVLPGKGSMLEGAEKRMSARGLCPCVQPFAMSEKKQKKKVKMDQNELEGRMRPRTLLEIDPTLAFKKEKWWHPKLTDEEARTSLEGAKPKTFLIRPSSQIPNFAVSYVMENGKIRKVLIINDEQGFHLEGYKDDAGKIEYYKTMQVAESNL